MSGHEDQHRPLVSSNEGLVSHNMDFLQEDFSRLDGYILSFLCLIPLGLSCGLLIPYGVQHLSTTEGTLRFIIGITAGLFALLSILIGLGKFLCCMGPRKRALHQLKEGRFLCHWAYAHQEWDDFLDYESGREWKSNIGSTVILIVLTPLFAVALAGLIKIRAVLKDKAAGVQSTFEMITFRELYIWCLVMCAVLVVILIIHGFILCILKFHRLRREHGQLVIADHSVWFCSLVQSWQSNNFKGGLFKLGGITVTQPAVQKWKYLKIATFVLVAQTPRGEKKKNIRALLPRAHLYDFVHAVVPQLQAANPTMVVDHAKLHAIVPSGVQNV